MIPQNTPPCHPSWAGIDVGKETLAVYIAAADKALTLENKTSAIQAFLQEHPDTTLVLESTGGYETLMVTLAMEAGHTVYRANARRVRAFMESVGIYAKTDAIDAKALAHFAQVNVRHLRPYVLPAPELKELLQLTRRRDDLIAMRTQEKNRLQAPDNTCLQKSVQKVLECLEEQVTAIEQKMDSLLQKSDNLQAKVKVLTAVKGVGNVTAVKLLVAMPELGQLSGKQAASLAGLAPYPRDSGKKKGRRRTRGGRIDVRTALYMSILSAVRYNETFKIFYDRLRKNGKLPMQAQMAAARKLLVILNAKLRDAAKVPIDAGIQLQTC